MILRSKSQPKHEQGSFANSVLNFWLCCHGMLPKSVGISAHRQNIDLELEGNLLFCLCCHFQDLEVTRKS